MKTLKAILFDIGNVILYFDNHRVSRRISELTQQPENKVFKYIFDLYAELELDLGKTPIHNFLQRVKDKLDLKLDLNSLKLIFSDIFTENEKVSNLIRNLKGRIPLLAVSNTNESHFEFIQEHYPIINLLDRVILSYEIGVKKPDPGIYFEALKFAKAQPQECLLIDDQEKNIIPAQLLGLVTHLYQSYETLVRVLHQFKIL